MTSEVIRNTPAVTRQHNATVPRNTSAPRPNNIVAFWGKENRGKKSAKLRWLLVVKPRAYLVRGGGWAWAGQNKGKLVSSALSVATRSRVGNFGVDMPTGSVAATHMAAAAAAAVIK